MIRLHPNESQQTPAKTIHFVGEEAINIEQIVSPVVLHDLEPTRLGPNCYQASDLAQVFYMAQDHACRKMKITLQSNKESMVLCAIKIVVEGKAEVDCILYNGSEIMCMLDAVSYQLGIPYDPNIMINMQSANGACNPTLGLAHNVTLAIGPFGLVASTIMIKMWQNVAKVVRRSHRNVSFWNLGDLIGDFIGNAKQFHIQFHS